MMHSKLCFLKIASVLFIKEIKIWNDWLPHLFTLKNPKNTLEQAVLKVVITVIIARITWFLIITLYVQSIVSLIL